MTERFAAPSDSGSDPLGLPRSDDLPGSEILLYESPEGDVQVDVRLDEGTVWLSLNQIADLFGRDKSVISRHLRNVFASGELEFEATVAKNATVQREGDREVVRQVEYFNLDAILSVGYRVNSKRGTQFRIWATSTLRDHLLRGYTLHANRLRTVGLVDLEQALDLLTQTMATHALVSDDGRAMLDLVRRYMRSWHLLREYDENRLALARDTLTPPRAELPLADARNAIVSLRTELHDRGEASELFGQDRNNQLAAILGSIEQTFDGKPLYPSTQERAAHLLYFTIKDHPFVDGNKRVGTLLFLEYLRRNGLLLRPDGHPRVADNAMVALALLVAESTPGQKDLMIRLIANLLGDAA